MQLIVPMIFLQNEIDKRSQGVKVDPGNPRHKMLRLPDGAKGVQT
jgi:hypothetical protein